MSWQENITEEEKIAIEELKRRTLKYITPKLLEDESLFYRFCKARDFNVDAAETMLRLHIDWREEFKIDTILTDYKPPEVLLKYIPSSVVGFDKEGCLVRYIDVGQFDFKGVWNSVKKIEIYKTLFQFTESDIARLTEHGKKTGKPQTTITFIYNFEKMSIANALNPKFLETGMHYSKVLQDNYPERVKKMISINASVVFPLIFPIVKSILASAFIAKIQVFGTDGWKEEFLSKINAEDLPAFLGGNKTDPDGNPLCSSFITHAKEVPKSYYRCNNVKKMSITPDVKKFTVTRFSKQVLNFEIKEAGSYLEWEFETESKDIGFSLHFRENSLKETKPVELIPKQRIDTSYEPEKGIFKCEKVGTYTITFDNSYSWIHQKEVRYRVKVKSSKDESNGNY